MDLKQVIICVRTAHVCLPLQVSWALAALLLGVLGILMKRIDENCHFIIPQRLI